jgi:hypothetical protein
MNAQEVADVLEIQVWASDYALTQSSLKEELESGWPDETDEDGPEDLAREVFEILQQRANILAGAYPFTCDGNRLSPNDERKVDSSYLFCLGLRYFGSEVDLNLRTREFEAVVKTAAESYFGGQAVRIGAPWSTGEITDYKTLLAQVSELLPEIGPPTREKAPGGGDAGWDIVLVKNFGDGRFSRIIALGNCATGLRNWKSKGAETAPRLFWSFFTKTPLADNPCLTFIAIPFLMTDDDKYAKAHHDCITFDRIRVCEHAPAANPAIMEWLETQRNNALEIPFL